MANLFRGRRGTHLSEFCLILFILFLFFVAPAINLVMFSFAFCKGQILVAEMANLAAVAETREVAMAAGDQLDERLKSPLWSSLNIAEPYQMKKGEEKVRIVLSSVEGGGVKSFSVDEGLPEALRPGFQDNYSKFSYSYEIDEPVKFRPFLNLASVPFVNQVPLMGAPMVVRFRASAPIENLRCLE
ncbi:MAG: hypothetical protein K2Z81_12945 [Cyanobacteria bacterium]|nr:hypothetical protein [Cyanobacteriota bacterium]